MIYKHLKFCRLSLLLILILSCINQTAGDILRDTKTNKIISYAGKSNSKPIFIPRPKQRFKEFRGVWVATVENIDFGKNKTIESFCREYRSVIANLVKINANAIIFQIRSMEDAFYPSKYAPWSRWFMGQEGIGPKNFDPLRFMIEEAHKHKLEFHAWLNPYRITGKSTMLPLKYLGTLHSKNFARCNPKLVLSLKIGNTWNLFLNPGEPAVKRHILNVVQEIAVQYPVDGIHFDDYFYPMHPLMNIDQISYKNYNPKHLKLSDWRRNNVTETIRDIKYMLNVINLKKNKKIKFGISPFGIWKNQKSDLKGSLTRGKESFFDQYADTRLWVKAGYIDYIVPQIYWSFANEIAPYAAICDWWSNAVKGTKVDLYIGHAAYKVGSSNKWPQQELYNQFCYNRKHTEIKGEVLYSYKKIFAAKPLARRKGIASIMRFFWSSPCNVR